MADNATMSRVLLIVGFVILGITMVMSAAADTGDDYRAANWVGLIAVMFIIASWVLKPKK